MATTTRVKEGRNIKIGDRGDLAFHLLSQHVTNPLQQYREFVQNGLEAGATVVAVDIDWSHLKRHRVYKFCVIDNGSGMDAMTLDSSLDLMQSTKAMGMDSNFGLGAKIAGAKFNPHGLIYETWTDKGGVIAGLKIHRPETKAQEVIVLSPVGTKQSTSVDYGPGAYSSLKIGPKQPGTKVTLLGRDRKRSVLSAQSPEILRYLNRRYLSFAEGSTVVVREKWQNRTEKDRRELKGGGGGVCDFRPVQGLRHFLQDHFLERDQAGKLCRGALAIDTTAPHPEHGSLPLTGMLEWYVVDETNQVFSHPYVPKMSMVGLVYHNEVYSEQQHLKLGIDMPANIVILLHIDDAHPTSDRMGLVWNGVDVPMEAIRDAFNANMPKGLSDYIRKQHSTRETTSVLEIIAKYKQFLDVPNHKPDPNGLAPVCPGPSAKQQGDGEGVGGGASGEGQPGTDPKGVNTPNAGGSLGSNTETKLPACANAYWMEAAQMADQDSIAEFDESMLQIKINKEHPDVVHLFDFAKTRKHSFMDMKVESKIKEIVVGNLALYVHYQLNKAAKGHFTPEKKAEVLSPLALGAIAVAPYGVIRMIENDIKTPTKDAKKKR